MKIKKHSGLRVFSTQDISDWGSCYDPKRYLAETWRGTAVDILKMDQVSVPDRLWVVLRTEIVSEKLMRLFAVWCARQVQHLMKDERSIRALDVAERFAHGQATQEELDAAWDAAWAAAWAAARDAAWAAARDAAWAAAWDAAWAAFWAAARDAAWAAAWDAQKNKLIEMVLSEGLQRVTLRAQKKRVLEAEKGSKT